MYPNDAVPQRQASRNMSPTSSRRIGLAAHVRPEQVQQHTAKESSPPQDKEGAGQGRAAQRAPLPRALRSARLSSACRVSGPLTAHPASAPRSTRLSPAPWRQPEVCHARQGQRQQRADDALVQEGVARLAPHVSQQAVVAAQVARPKPRRVQRQLRGEAGPPLRPPVPKHRARDRTPPQLARRSTLQTEAAP